MLLKAATKGGGLKICLSWLSLRASKIKDILDDRAHILDRGLNSEYGQDNVADPRSATAFRLASSFNFCQDQHKKSLKPHSNYNQITPEFARYPSRNGGIILLGSAL